MSATLYEIADLRAIIDRALEESDGELTPEVEEALALWDAEFAHKAESVALYICEQERLAEAVKAEEQILAARRRGLLRRAENLTNYLQSQMERTNTTRVNGVLKTLVMQKNPPAVKEVIETTQEDLRAIWESAGGVSWYVTRKPEVFSWNRDGIKDATKAGTLPESIAKRVVVSQSVSLRIK